MVELGLPLLDRRLAGEIVPAERRLALIFRSVVVLPRLIGGERRLRLIELLLIVVALDAEQLRSFRYRCAVLIIDRFKIALDARDKIHLLERRGVARQLEIQRHRLLQRLRDDDLWRRGRDVRVSGGVAAREGERGNRSKGGNRSKDGLAEASAFAGREERQLNEHAGAVPRERCNPVRSRPRQPLQIQGAPIFAIGARRWSGRNADRPVEPDSATFTNSDDGTRFRLVCGKRY